MKQSKAQISDWHIKVDETRHRSADDRFLDSLFSAYVSFSEEKSQEINYWKEAYRKEAEKTRYLWNIFRTKEYPCRQLSVEI